MATNFAGVTRVPVAVLDVGKDEGVGLLVSAPGWMSVRHIASLVVY
jgi:hypothetical protein